MTDLPLSHYSHATTITPYCWPARMDPDLIWYYGWDCASGCIWDASTIHQVTRITHP